MMIDTRELKRKDCLIEVIATDIADLAMMGFGSVKNCRSVYGALIAQYSHVHFNIVRTQSDLDAIIYRRPGLVFSGIKYIIASGLPATKNSEGKIWISECMEEANINYAGSGKDAVALEFSKDDAKQRVAECGVPTAAYFVATPGMYNHEDGLPIDYPLFVKPLREGDGKGIGSDSIVYDFDGYRDKVRDIYTMFNQASLVEALLTGREFTVAILGLDSLGEPVAMPVEILGTHDNAGKSVLGYETKQANREVVAAIDDEETYQRVSAVAKAAFVALGAKDYGRIDIRMDDKGHPQFLEANLVPGMTQRPNDIECSYFPRACFINANMSYAETICRIAAISTERGQRTPYLTTPHAVASSSCREEQHG